MAARKAKSSIPTMECEQSCNLDEFLFSDHKFASAGREDIDVLMLGRGKSEWLFESGDRLFMLVFVPFIIIQDI